MRPDDTPALVLRGGTSAAIGYLVRFGARLLFLFLAARLFGVALFGAFSLGVAAVELGAAVGLLGMKRLLFKFLDGPPAGRAAAHQVLDAALLVTVASAVLAAAMMLAILAIPAAAIADNSRLALLLVAPMIVGQSLLDLVLTATRWKARMRYEVAARSLVEPYAAILALLAACQLGFAETGLLLSYWAGTLAALAYGLFGLRRCFGGLVLRAYRPSPPLIRTMFRTALFPTSTDLAAAMFARIDLYLVGLFAGEATAGIYAMARQVRTPIRQVRQSLDGMLTPVLSRTLAAQGPVETGRVAAAWARLILAVQLPLLIAIVAVGEPFLAWFGPEYVAAYAALVILAAAETILGAFGVADLILLYRRPAATLWITGLGLLVNFAGAALLIGGYGISGAAFAVLVAVAFSALLRRHLLRASFGLVIPLAYNLAPLAALAAAASAGLAAALLLAGLPGLPRDLALLAVALGAYAAVLRVWMRGRRPSVFLAELRAG